MGKPLDFLEITEMNSGYDPIIHEIPISSISKNGIIIGRHLPDGRERLADYEIGSNIPSSNQGTLPIKRAIGKRHLTIYAVDNPERESPDIYLRRGYKENGNWVSPEENVGIDVYIAGVPMDRYHPIQLRPGTLVDLVPKLGTYQCKLQWAIESEKIDSNPTVPVDENVIAQLQFERRNLIEREKVKDIQIEQLKELQNKIKQYADEFKSENLKLKAEIRTEREVNEAQDVQIKNQRKLMNGIKICGVLIAALMAVSLGVDAEEIENFMEIATMIAGGGLIFVASGKSL